MNVKALSRHDIIMNFTTPPGADDIACIANSVLKSMPGELKDCCEELKLQIEEFPDAVIEDEMDIETPYDLLALYRSANEISPGIEKKTGSGEDTLILYRRPILDLWSETGDDLASLVREVVIEEIARASEFSDSEIQALIKSL